MRRHLLELLRQKIGHRAQTVHGTREPTKARVVLEKPERIR
jgi:hypothetical protein